MREESVIARKEVAENLATFRFWFAALLTVALTVLTMLASAESYEDRRSMWRTRLAEEHEALRHVPTYSYLRIVALRPPEPLSIVDQGFDARFGSALRLSLTPIPGSAREEPLGNEFLIAWPAVDVTTIVAVALSFIALLLTCDVFPRESERGTRRSLAVTGVARRQLLAGKYLGALGTMSALLLVVLAIGSGFLLSYARHELTASDYARLAAMAGVYFTYLSLMVLSGLVLSLYARSSSRAVVHAIVGWLLIVLVVPDLVGTLAAGVRRVEDLRWEARSWEQQQWESRRSALRAEYLRHPLLLEVGGHMPIFAEEKADSQGELLRFGSARYYDERTRYYAFYAATGQPYAGGVEAAYRPAERALYANRQAIRRWQALWPRTVLEEVAHTLAGTSMDEEDRFFTASRRYRAQVFDYLIAKRAFRSWRWFTDDTPETLFPWPRFFGLSESQVSAKEAERLFPQLANPPLDGIRRRRIREIKSDPRRFLALDDLPRFRYREPDLAVACRRAARGAGGLLLANLLMAGWAWLAAGREP